MAGRVNVQIYPEELAFAVEPGKDAHLTLSLYNPASSPVAFKIKTTSTDRYRVRPNFAVVPAHETKHVKVIDVFQRWFGADGYSRVTCRITVDRLSGAVSEPWVQIHQLGSVYARLTRYGMLAGVAGSSV